MPIYLHISAICKHVLRQKANLKHQLHPHLCNCARTKQRQLHHSFDDGEILQPAIQINRDSCPFSWNSLLREAASPQEALHLFCKMKNSGAVPDNFTYSLVMSACASLGFLWNGRAMHQCIVKRGFDCMAPLMNGVITLYAKCGCVQVARQVFDGMPVRDSVSWNAMITGYVKSNRADYALSLFCRMFREGIEIDAVTVLGVLAANGFQSNIGPIHQYILRNGFQCHLMVANSLISAYSRGGCVACARKVFGLMNSRSVGSWNAMIAGLVQNRHCHEAAMLFKKMNIAAEMKPDLVTILSIFQACSLIECVEFGSQVHSFALREGFMEEITESCLVDMYAKCGNLHNAKKVFDKMGSRDSVTYTAMISGFVKNGLPDEALTSFGKMQLRNIRADAVTVSSILPACSQLTLLSKGKEIHGYVMRNGFESNCFVLSSLVDMYSKCGSPEYAYSAFGRSNEKDTALWTAMITGYAIHGLGSEALALFDAMKTASVLPDSTTFVAVLSACNHSGMVDEALEYFNSMATDFGVSPDPQHYACIVDVLGRTGHLKEAYRFAQGMHFQPTASIWDALLGACMHHNNAELANQVAEYILQLDPENGQNYLFSWIHAGLGKWKQTKEAMNMMKAAAVEMRPGCSWIEIRGQTYVFAVGSLGYLDQ